jgi:uncharacterized membrane protein (UPF0127 family)
VCRLTRILKTHFEQANGLMFTKKKSDFGLLFVLGKEKKCPMTMLFVFYPIDIIWVNAKKVVVDCTRAGPFAPHIPHKGLAAYVVEVPVGTIKKAKITPGDVLDF